MACNGHEGERSAGDSRSGGRKHERAKRAEPLGSEREEAISKQAYALWHKQGRPEGKDREHWLQTDIQNTPAIQQHVKQDLEKAGFTNVQVMPASFLVRAHDKQDRPVMTAL